MRFDKVILEMQILEAIKDSHRLLVEVQTGKQLKYTKLLMSKLENDFSVTRTKLRDAMAEWHKLPEEDL